jgi:tetratricopeptide (TPR) repeat protein
MDTVAEFEIHLRRQGEGDYTAGFRFRPPKSEAYTRIGPAQAVKIFIDFTGLLALAGNLDSYARKLTDDFFRDPGVREVFQVARASADGGNAALCVRLDIDPDAEELQGVYWELLQDPDRHAPLFTGERIYFSRYLSSGFMRPIEMRKKKDLNALVFIASPTDLDEQSRLMHIDVKKEFGHAKAGLKSIRTRLYDGGAATLDGLIDAVSEHKPAILYVVCHGQMLRDEPFLLLEDTDRRKAIIPGQELVDRLVNLENPPLMVVLTSCESAGYDTAGRMRSALGPRLVEAGIPVVVAMQGKISVPTAAKFIPAFFRALGKDGQVERAMAVARGKIREYSDAWMPVLFSRLISGRLVAKAEPVQIPWKWVTLGLAGLFLTAGLWQVFRIKPMTGQVNVAVATFTEIVDGREQVTDRSRQFSELLATNIETERESLPESISFQLRGPDQVRQITGTDRKTAAQKRAKQHNATILIYGQIQPTTDGDQVVPEFYVDPRDIAYGGEVVGADRMGQPVKLKGSPVMEAFDTNESLIIRTRVLRGLVQGISYLVMNNYNLAEATFETAAAEPGWERSEGKEVGYLLLGAARLLSYDPVTNTEVLPGARDAFEIALGMNQNYPRPYLGLGDVLLLSAQNGKESEAGQLKEAKRQYEKAQELAGSDEVIAAKVAFGLGRVDVKGLNDGLLDWADKEEEALNYFNAVIKAYGNGRQPLLVWQAAHSHASLGYLAGRHKNWTDMASEYRKAIDLLHPLPGRPTRTYEARYWAMAGFANAINGDTAAGKAAYKQAIQIGKNAPVGPQELADWEKILNDP